VYADDCCHLNQRGTDLLAGLLAEWLRSRMEAPAGAPASPALRRGP
jgi:hypothetical protein